MDYSIHITHTDYSICMHYTNFKRIPKTNGNVKHLPQWRKWHDCGGHGLNGANGSCGRQQRGEEHTKKEDEEVSNL